MDDACSAVVRTRSGYAHMRTHTGCSGVRWEGPGAYSESSPDVCAGGRRRPRECSAACASAHALRPCAHAQRLLHKCPPHAQIRYRLQSAEPSLTGGKNHVRKTQKEMVPGVFYMRTCERRGARECSVCAHAHALRKCIVHCTGLPCCVPNCPSAPHAHLRTLCACAHALRTCAHAHRCCQVLTLTVETTIRVLFGWDINTSPFKGACRV